MCFASLDLRVCGKPHLHMGNARIHKNIAMAAKPKPLVKGYTAGLGV
jgi:hypothetical protein